MFARYEVKGSSMRPTLKEGDRVLLLKTKKVKKNNVIVFSMPERECIKRVTAVNSNRLFVEGDNKSESTDSTSYGEIKREQVIGKVVMNY